MNGPVDAIRLDAADNTATVLHDVTAGDSLRVRRRAGLETIVAAQPIPLCHKISLSAIKAGEAVTKFGQQIGVATTDIAAGTHVHVHNITSCRGKKSS